MSVVREKHKKKKESKHQLSDRHRNNLISVEFKALKLKIVLSLVRIAKTSGPCVGVGYDNMGCGVFKRGYKIRKILPKNQHTQREFLNFENWLAKIRPFKVIFHKIDS